MKIFKLVTSLLMFVSLSINLILSASAQNTDALYIKSSEILLNELSSATESGETGDDWAVIALADTSQTDKIITDKYKTLLAEYISETINSDNRLSRNKSTENSRVILAISSIGYDAKNFYGYNLADGLSDISYVKKQGINGVIWALIALDCRNYSIADNVTANRTALVNEILNGQNDDGGWSISGNTSDPDVTAMALTALANYKDEYNSGNAIEKGLNFLSAIQNKNGGFSSFGVENSESCAQVIIALCTLGINPVEDKRFIKDNNILDSLISYSCPEGGFGHADLKYNHMATVQANLAIKAFNLLSENKRLYDFNTLSADENQDDIFTKGDIDADGEVTAADARLCLRLAVGLEKTEIGSLQWLCADVDNDDNITASDARLILRAAVNLEVL